MHPLAALVPGLKRRLGPAFPPPPRGGMILVNRPLGRLARARRQP